ncbi:unnamed protein product, partial [marine sediment metagenome]
CLLTKSKRVRKIGKNKIVLRAVDLLSQYCEDAFFITLVPDVRSNLTTFYQDTLINSNPVGFSEWDVRNWGYIAWAEVEDFCKRHGLVETLQVFEFNLGQIYDKH